MSPAERKMAENEITLLKVLVGPTIIRYYDSFVENECINIVMEFAEGGNLSDRLEEYKAKGIMIANEQILYWTAQLVLGILLMHSKNIIHRDIKTLNMFLTKNDIIKVIFCISNKNFLLKKARRFRDFQSSGHPKQNG